MIGGRLAFYISRMFNSLDYMYFFLTFTDQPERTYMIHFYFCFPKNILMQIKYFINVCFFKVPLHWAYFLTFIISTNVPHTVHLLLFMNYNHFDRLSGSMWLSFAFFSLLHCLLCCSHTSSRVKLVLCFKMFKCASTAAEAQLGGVYCV